MSSSMLEQAVIDAQELKEAAMKNAEQEVLEKYAGEIKGAVSALLEQEDPMAMDPMAMGGAITGAQAAVSPEEQVVTNVDKITDDLPLKAFDGTGLNELQEGDEIELDLDALIKSVGADQESEESDLMLEASTTELQELLEQSDKLDEFLPAAAGIAGRALAGAGASALASKGIDAAFGDDDEPEPDLDPETAQSNLVAQFGGEEEMAAEELYEEDDLDEEFELDEESLKDAIAEMLKVDLQNVPRGMLGTTHPTRLEQVRAVEVCGAADEDTEHKEQNEEFEKVVKKIENLEEQVKSLKSEKNRLLKEHKELKSIAHQVSKKLTELNITNAKLVYKNRILESNSLNERQKEKLVEAVSKANSIKEAKVIYETLQESLNSKSQNAPKNLNEAVSKNNRLVLKSNNKETPVSDAATERMKKLAGII